MVDIYKITNTINDKKYIGVASGGYKSRFREHIARAFEIKENTLLYKAMRKYGKEAFKVERIGCAETFEDALVMEKYYVDKYRTFYRNENSNGYNMTNGGKGFGGINNKCVVQVDLNGNYINEYESIKQAHNETGVSCNSISVSCSCPKIDGGRITNKKWIWVYKEDYLREVGC